MTKSLLLTSWLFAMAIGLASGAWRRTGFRDKWVAASILLICVLLTAVLAIDVKLPNLTDWVDAALAPFRPLLEPVKE